MRNPVNYLLQIVGDPTQYPFILAADAVAAVCGHQVKRTVSLKKEVDDKHPIWIMRPPLRWIVAMLMKGWIVELTVQRVKYRITPTPMHL